MHTTLHDVDALEVALHAPWIAEPFVPATASVTVAPAALAAAVDRAFVTNAVTDCPLDAQLAIASAAGDVCVLAAAPQDTAPLAVHAPAAEVTAPIESVLDEAAVALAALNAAAALAAPHEPLINNAPIAWVVACADPALLDETLASPKATPTALLAIAALAVIVSRPHHASA